MISEKIKNAAEKAMPKEKRFIDGIRRFFEKKPRRLIVSGVIAVAFLYPVYREAPNHIDGLPLMILEFIQVTATGALFANINAFSLKKYACAVSVWSLVLYLAAATWGVLSGMGSPDDPMLVVGCLRLVLLGIPVCATIIALSVLLAYLTVRGMKTE